MRAPREAKILVADDHVEMARLLGDELKDAGYDVTCASSGKEALALLERSLPDLVVTDLRMQEVDGLDVLRAARALDPDLPVIIMTAFGAVDTAIDAIKAGAFHYLTKPFQLSEALIFVGRALEGRRLRDEHASLNKQLRERSGLGAMVGRSAVMLDMFELIERVAPTTMPAMIRGESGSGKELVARAIHQQSARAAQPFVAVNCTALPEALLESELFGHVRGAFTGATTARRGLFVEADGGTLFLDEIGDMAPSLQAKLLRVLEDGQVRAIGADSSRKVDVRLIAATHQDIEERIREGKFRSDLFYRLNVLPVRVPALRERVEDLPGLVEHFVARARAASPNARARELAPEVVAAMADRPWPGNVRELENVVKRLVTIGCDEVIRLREYQRHVGDEAAPSLSLAWQTLAPLRRMEEEYIAHVLRRCDGNKSRAAEILGIDVSTLHRRERAAKDGRG